MTTDPRPITQRLREDTKDLHTRAEKGEFQAALVSGRLPKEQYVDMLEQMLPVHRALDAALRCGVMRVPQLRQVVRDEHYQEPYLVEDLGFFGRDPARVQPLHATQQMVDQVERVCREDPVALLGLHYVLEGANNGNKFIAKVVQKTYGLQPGPGTRYLEPYGERQPQVWAQFKQDLEACTFTPDEAELVVRAAEDMFRGMIAIHDELHAPVDAVRD